MKHRYLAIAGFAEGSLLLGTVALLLVATAPLPAQQELTSTDLLVRVVAADAKVIGSGVGGVRVTIRDASSGELLAEGVQEGGTGSTDRIVRQPRVRGESVYDTEGTAGFLASLELRRPTVVEVTAEGPLDYPGSARTASTTLLMIPGEDVTGDGLVLTLHGFVLRVLSPEEGTRVEAGQPIRVRAHLQMMCGCPTEPGGLWDSDRYGMEARLLSEGELVAEAPLEFAGKTSHFEADLRVPDRLEPDGALEVEVVAFDPERVNFGHDRVRLEPTGDDLGRRRPRP
ncbi:MAG: hypothetical protein ACOC83_00035 [Gemmatimonadota bacterium]